VYLCRWYKGPEVNNILPVSGSNFPLITEVIEEF
jgi:hypothetical protein